jgi:hypothetical protein
MGVSYTNAVSDLLAQLDVHLLGHTLRYRHGGDSARLRASHHLRILLREIVKEHELRDLRRLSGTGLADEDEDLRLLVQLEELFALLVHGQASPRLEDAQVLARERPPGEGVVGAVFGAICLRCGCRMALEALEPCAGAAAIRALDGLLVVPVRQVRVRCGCHLAVAVGFCLDSLDAGVVIVVKLALGRGCHLGEVSFVVFTCECRRHPVFQKKLCAGGTSSTSAIF